MTARPLPAWAEDVHDPRLADYGPSWWCDVHDKYEPTPCDDLEETR